MGTAESRADPSGAVGARGSRSIATEARRRARGDGLLADPRHPIGAVGDPCRLSVSKAVILAGGPPSKRFPLAHQHPKLCLPVANEPLLAHLLRLLARQGITEATLICCRRADCEALLALPVRQAAPGIRLSAVLDSGANGTAGCLRSARAVVGRDPFVLIAGSAYPSGLDLPALARAHAGADASITVVLRQPEVGSRAPYEQIQTTPDGRIVSIRVPYGALDAEATPRSAGVYLCGAGFLDLLPPTGRIDLKEQLLALLDARGRVARGFSGARDIARLDHLEDYLRLNDMMLGGRPAAAGRGWRRARPGVWLGPGSELSPGAVVTGCALIGEQSRVEAGARLEGPVVIGAGCHVGSGAVIRSSVLWSRVRVGAGARIDRSAITDECSVPARAHVRASVVMDARSGWYRGPSGPAGDEATLLHRAGKLRRATADSLHGRVGAVVKRTVDIAGSAAGLVLLSPLLLAIAGAIKLDSPGPVLYRSERCARHGRPFLMYKFRTMRPDAAQLAPQLAGRTDVDGPMFKLRRDPRVTRIGTILRKLSLDELPQLYNVLRGTMSLVGPRPLTMQEMSCAPAWRDWRLSVKQGLTGLWQVSGRSDVGFSSWIELDLEYVRRQSLRLDFRILLRTVGAVVTSRGAV